MNTKYFFYRLFLTIFSVLMLVGCAATTNHMTEIKNEFGFKPSTDKTMVVFMRPSSYGDGILSTVYDGLDYIGTLPGQTKFIYQTEPGEHMFMVIGESADFMKADLAPNKTYFARVVARIGVWKARFSFIPYNGRESEDDLQEWLEDTTLMKTNKNGKQWANENKDSIETKYYKYLPAWLKKNTDAQMKQTLLKSSGR